MTHATTGQVPAAPVTVGSAADTPGAAEAVHAEVRGFGLENGRRGSAADRDRAGKPLAEAGFPPNVLQARLDDDSLLESLARLTRELSHFPTRPELRIRAQDPDFPSANTFARFGRKSQVAERLQRFCSERPEFADVLPLAALAARNSPPSASSPDTCTC